MYLCLHTCIFSYSCSITLYSSWLFPPVIIPPSPQCDGSIIISHYPDLTHDNDNLPLAAIYIAVIELDFDSSSIRDTVDN